MILIQPRGAVPVAFLGAVTLLTSSAQAQPTRTSADLGPATTTGQDASQTIAKRATQLHFAMACGNEFAFAEGFALASRHGKKGYAPDKDLAQWPVTLMLGKAAWLIDPSRQVARLRGNCESTLSGAIREDWGRLTREGRPRDGESDVDLVKRVYQELYDSTDGANGALCATVANVPEGGGVRLSLTDACILRQIRAVMTHPRHGPWTEEGGVVKPEFAGTSASKLPCLSEFKFKVEGIDGDWDMAVIEYTRLASLLYRYRRLSRAMGGDVFAALAALNRRFLTLRSSPQQGATAREVFNLLTSCGNLPNQFGDANDTVTGSGADPGSDRYSEDSKDAIGKKSFWKACCVSSPPSPFWLRLLRQPLWQEPSLEPLPAHLGQPERWPQRLPPQPPRSCSSRLRVAVLRKPRTTC